MLPANVGIKSASVLAFGLVLSMTLSWTPICRQAASSWFSGSCSTRAAWRCVSSCEPEVVVSAQWSSNTLWGRCTAEVQRDICRKEDWTWKTDCRIQLKWILYCGDIWRSTFFAASPRTTEDLVKSLQAAMTTVDVNKLTCILENAVQRTSVCCKMDRSCFEHRLYNKTPMVWSSDSLCNLTVTCIMKTKRHRI